MARWNFRWPLLRTATFAMQKQTGLSESCAHPDCPFAVTDSGAYGGFCCKRGPALHGCIFIVS